MNCPHCSLVIEDADPKMTMPCCTTLYHSTCTLQMLANSPYWYPVRCACGVLLCGNDDPVPEPVPDTPEYRADMRAYKKAITEANVAKRNLTKALVPLKRSFKEAAAPHAEAIKTLKKEGSNTIKAIPEYKAYGSKLRKYSFMLARLRKTYGFGAIGHRKFGRYRDRLSCIINRSFRIRV